MSTYTNIYFIGIGGIGMSAIARYYNAKGFKVSGYDKTPSPLTEALVAEGIEVHYTDDCSYIPKDVENTLVVYTPAAAAGTSLTIRARSRLVLFLRIPQ